MCRIFFAYPLILHFISCMPANHLTSVQVFSNRKELTLVTNNLASTSVTTNAQYQAF